MKTEMIIHDYFCMETFTGIFTWESLMSTNNACLYALQSGLSVHPAVNVYPSWRAKAASGGSGPVAPKRGWALTYCWALLFGCKFMGHLCLFTVCNMAHIVKIHIKNVRFNISSKLVLE